MLLPRVDVNPDEPDTFGRTPLWWAACYGHEGIVKMLLRRDEVNPDQPDNQGQVPLWYAAENATREWWLYYSAQHLPPATPPKPEEASPSLPFSDAVLIICVSLSRGPQACRCHCLPPLTPV